MQIEKAVNYFGNKARIAEALKISRAAVSRWKIIPPRRVYELKELMDKQKSNNNN